MSDDQADRIEEILKGMQQALPAGMTRAPRPYITELLRAVAVAVNQISEELTQTQERLLQTQIQAGVMFALVKLRLDAHGESFLMGGHGVIPVDEVSLDDVAMSIEGFGSGPMPRAGLYEHLKQLGLRLKGSPPEDDQFDTKDDQFDTKPPLKKMEIRKYKAPWR